MLSCLHPNALSKAVERIDFSLVPRFKGLDMLFRLLLSQIVNLFILTKNA